MRLVGELRNNPALPALIAALALTACAYLPEQYPVCNFRCYNEQGQDCALRVGELEGVTRLVAKRVPGSSADILGVSQSYVVFGASPSGHRVLQQYWPLFLCIAPSSSDIDAEKARYSACLRNAKRWSEMALTRGISELLTDSKYRNVCLATTYNIE